MKYVLIPTLFLLISCEYLLSPQDDNIIRQGHQNTVPPISPGGSPSPAGPSQPEESEWGQVKCAHEATQEIERFNLHVKKFLSSSLDPSNLPGIGCLDKHRGGFFFKGSIKFEGTTGLDPSRLNTLAQMGILASSYIEIHVDTGQTDEDKKKYEVTPLRLPIASSGNTMNVNGIVNLNFTDPRSTVSLVGTINQEIFSGEFRYQNSTTWKNTLTGDSGTIGFFQIKTCKFFQCN